MAKLNKISIGVSCNAPIWVIPGPAQCYGSIVAVFTDERPAKAHWRKLNKAEPDTYHSPVKMYTNKPIPQCVGYKGKKAIYV